MTTGKPERPMGHAWSLDAYVAVMWCVLVLLALSLAGMKLLTQQEQVKPAPSGPGGKEVVELWAGVIMGRYDEKALRQAVSEFNRRNKEVFIDAHLIPYSMYQTKINIAIATGQPPDVAYNAFSVVNEVRQRQKSVDLTVPIPGEMISPREREAWGPTLLECITKDGKITKFPNRTYLMGGVMQGNLDYFERAGVDIFHYLETGWDYATFKREMAEVQAVMREEMGPEAYAFGLNLRNVHTMLYDYLLPPIIGDEAAGRRFLQFDEARGRYLLDAAVTPATLAEPMQFMYELIHEDALWGRKYLGMDFGQIGSELYDRRLLAVTFQNTPSYSMLNEIKHNMEYEKGLKDEPFQAVNVPYPTPHEGTPYVFGMGADGWGVIRQIPYKGDAHTRAALEVAKYLASPEVLAAEYQLSGGLRAHPWPDAEAVLELAGEVDDPVNKNERLAYLWERYNEWRESGNTFPLTGGDWPAPAGRGKLLSLTQRYLGSGEGKQILERALFGEVESTEAARQILAGLENVIEAHYERRTR